MSTLRRMAAATAEKAVAHVRFRRRLAAVSRSSAPSMRMEPDCPPRVNLIVPSVAPDKVFGGIATALRLFHALAQELGQAHRRILVLDDNVAPGDGAGLAGYEVVPAGWAHAVERAVTCLTAGVPVRAGDVFFATHWKTALVARRLLDQQAQAFGGTVLPLFYVIQDFEPAFNPWSTEYLLAESTYSPRDGGVIGVFNTRLLYDYFVGQGYQVSRSYVFEPTMNPKLRALLAPPGAARKKRHILVYGRPSKPRNGFWLLVEALKLWSGNYAHAAQWQVLSIGEQHPSIPMANGVMMRSVGKLSLEQYAALLNEAAVGVSLMISPHPSYPPLEMSHFGLHTITNSFGGKDLSRSYPGVTSLSPCTPEALAGAIEAACERHRAGERPMHRDVAAPSPFLRDEPEFPFIGQLAQDVRGLWNGPRPQ
jgi:hypothetical protein